MVTCIVPKTRRIRDILFSYCFGGCFVIRDDPYGGSPVVQGI